MGSNTKLKDVRLEFNKRVLGLSLLLIGFSIVLANILSYLFSRAGSHPLVGVTIGSCLGASIGIIGSYWILSSQILVKTREKTYTLDVITIKRKSKTKP